MLARATGAPRFSCSSVAMLTPFMQQLQQQQADPISAPPNQQAGPVSAPPTSPNQQAGLVSVSPGQQAGPVSAPPSQQAGERPASTAASGSPPAGLAPGGRQAGRLPASAPATAASSGPPTAPIPGGRLMLLTTVRYKQLDPPQPPRAPPPTDGLGAFGSPLDSSLAPSSITPSSTYTARGWLAQPGGWCLCHPQPGPCQQQPGPCRPQPGY